MVWFEKGSLGFSGNVHIKVHHVRNNINTQLWQSINFQNLVFKTVWYKFIGIKIAF